MKRYSLVIIDDNAEWCGLLERQLEQYAIFRLYPSLNEGEAALEFVQQFRPDIIILDLIMPHCDGLYILSRIRELPGGYHPFIYVLSAMNIDRAIERLVSLDVDYYSSKPIGAQVVAYNLNKLVQESRLSEAQALEDDIETLLHDLGAPMHLLSTRVAREALRICYEEEAYLYNITGLYRTVAAQMETYATYSSVERNIRSTVQNIQKSPSQLFQEQFADKGKLTNRDFLYRSVQLLRQNAAARNKWRRDQGSLAKT